MNIILSGPLCQCKHTHVYGEIQYCDCPYCDCHEHTDKQTGYLAIYNIKRWKTYVRKHKQPRVKVDQAIDSEIKQMLSVH